jgi:hypothetical protein
MTKTRRVRSVANLDLAVVAERTPGSNTQPVRPTYTRYTSR